MEIGGADMLRRGGHAAAWRFVLLSFFLSFFFFLFFFPLPPARGRLTIGGGEWKPSRRNVLLCFFSLSLELKGPRSSSRQQAYLLSRAHGIVCFSLQGTQPRTTPAVVI